MIRQSIFAGFCAALAAGPAFAQEAAQEQGLPELDPAAIEEIGNLEDLAAQSTAAQQMGNLATTKAVSGVVGQLGSVMVLLHSQILDRLGGGTTDADQTAAMPEDVQNQLDELSRATGQDFALGFSEWVVDASPGMIEIWQEATDAASLGDFGDAVLEQLEGQQAVAGKIADADGALEEIDGETRQTLSWAGADDRGNVAQQPGDQSSGITTELPEDHEPGAGKGEGEGSIQSDR